MIKIAIIGGAGYSGGELARILVSHPKVQIKSVIEVESFKGKNFTSIYPNLQTLLDLKFEAGIKDLNLKKLDLVFLALPHTISMNYVPEILNAGKIAIDFGADFRLKKETYEMWYKTKHTAAEFIKEAVYGLPELYREKIKNSKLIANPGCYPTSIILGLAPLMKENIIDLNSIIIDAKSGVSGAGRGLNLVTHFPECNESVQAYNIGKHRHTPEIEEQLSILAQKKIKVSFTPHLIPMSRGILSTIYSNLKRKIKTYEVINIYKNFYKEEIFVRILPEGKLPQTKYVYSSNFCDIGIAVDERLNRLIVVSVIDNLMKGAAGQAVQNMNIIFNFSEDEGLKTAGIFP